MQNRDDPGDLQYRAIDIPWFYAGHNVYERAFRLKESFERIGECLEELGEFRESFESHPETIEQSQVSEIFNAIRDLMEGVEGFQWNFPNLAYQYWFGGFMGDVAHAFWRIEDGKFSNAPGDSDELHLLAREVERIHKNVHGSTRHGFYSRLDEFIEQMDWHLVQGTPPPRYEDEIREAKDLFCLGYYATALIVLGRSVEKALLELGRTRDVRSVKAYDEIDDWEETKYYHKNEALRQVDMPGKHGKVISERQYHQISILINYRNNVAHTEYENISRAKAIRQCSDAADLLIELEEKREYLEELDLGEIEPVKAQKVN